MAEASDTLSAPADQREFSQHPATPPSPVEHPLGLKDLQEARDALQSRLLWFVDDELDELRGVSLTLHELSLTSAEAVGPSEPEAFLYLARKLNEAVKAVAEWHQRTQAMAYIVSEGDMKALDRYPHLLPKSEEA